MALALETHHVPVDALLRPQRPPLCCRATRQDRERLRQPEERPLARLDAEQVRVVLGLPQDKVYWVGHHVRDEEGRLRLDPMSRQLDRRGYLFLVRRPDTFPKERIFLVSACIATVLTPFHSAPLVVLHRLDHRQLESERLIRQVLEAEIQNGLVENQEASNGGHVILGSEATGEHPED